jgi:AhpD family alkylhydroperoxidase
MNCAWDWYLWQWVDGRSVTGVTSASRIDFDLLPAPLQNRLAPRVERLGYLGEFFQVAAHQPAALAGFIDFTEALKVALPVRLVEVIALTAAAATGNDYERVQHERLALRVGLTRDEVAALVAGRPGDAAFAPDELAAAALTDAAVRAQGRSCADAYERLSCLVGDEAAVACLMTATRYLAHATMANTWGLRPPVASPLEETSDVR